MNNVLATHGIMLVFHASDEENRQHLELLRSRLNGAGIAYTLRRSDGRDNGASFSQVALITPDGVTTLDDDSCVVERSQPLEVFLQEQPAPQAAARLHGRMPVSGAFWGRSSATPI